MKEDFILNIYSSAIIFNNLGDDSLLSRVIPNYLLIDTDLCQIPNMFINRIHPNIYILW